MIQFPDSLTNKSKQKKVSYSLIIILLVFSRPALLSADSHNSKTFIYGIESQGYEVEPELFPLIESYIKIEFSRYRIVLQKVEIPGGQLDPGTLKQYEAPAAIIFRISATDSELNLEAELYPPDSGKPVIRVTKAGPIDITMDLLVTALVDELLQEGSEFIPDQSPDSTDSQEIQDDILKTAGEEHDENSLNGEGGLPVRIAAGVAPFIAVGLVNYYFNFGLYATLQSGYTFSTPIGLIEAGINTGFLIFSAEGLLAESSNILLPFGISGRWIKVISENFSLNLALSAGGALVHMAVNEELSLNKLDIFVSAGAGLTIGFAPNWGITVETEYLVFIEQYYPIMGIVPQIHFYYRL